MTELKYSNCDGETMKKVEINFNLQKFCLSMRETKPKAKKKHRKSILIKDASFAVQRAGHKKAVESGVRNVHAYVRGELIEMSKNKEIIENLKKSGKKVRYNPFRMNNFHDENMNPILESEHAYLEGNLIYVK